jgi:hypothetical protein
MRHVVQGFPAEVRAAFSSTHNLLIKETRDMQAQQNRNVVPRNVIDDYILRKYISYLLHHTIMYPPRACGGYRLSDVSRTVGSRARSEFFGYPRGNLITLSPTPSSANAITTCLLNSWKCLLRVEYALYQALGYHRTRLVGYSNRQLAMTSPWRNWAALGNCMEALPRLISLILARAWYLFSERLNGGSW